MITTLEVTLKINVMHPKPHLDQNSVKATINAGMAAITDEGAELLTTISDDLVESINVSVIQLKVHGKREAVCLYGTDEVPWGRA